MAYSIEEEQELNQLKDWWKENAKVVILAFVLGIAGVLGWRFWQSHQVNQIVQASEQYDALAYSSQQDKVAQFVQANSKTSYAVFALLDEAKSAVEKQDFAAAENALKQALEQSQDEVLTNLAALRLGEVQFQLGQFDMALSSLSQVKAAGFSARKMLLTADIQLAKGDNNAAKAELEEVVKVGSPLEQQMAQMKLNNLL